MPYNDGRSECNAEGGKDGIVVARNHREGMEVRSRSAGRALGEDRRVEKREHREKDRRLFGSAGSCRRLFVLYYECCAGACSRDNTVIGPRNVVLYHGSKTSAAERRDHRYGAVVFAKQGAEHAEKRKLKMDVCA